MVLEQSKTKWIPLQNVHWPLSEPAEKIARPCAKKKKKFDAPYAHRKRM